MIGESRTYETTSTPINSEIVHRTEVTLTPEMVQRALINYIRGLLREEDKGKPLYNIESRLFMDGGAIITWTEEEKIIKRPQEIRL